MFLKRILKDVFEDISISRVGVRTTTLKTTSENNPKSLHIIIPHRLNWRLTASAVNAFLRLSERPCVVTVVCNFSEIPVDANVWKVPNVNIISNQHTKFGSFILKWLPENGSKSNALALDSALKIFPEFEWAFMAHSDSAPLCRGWDRIYFEQIGNGRVLGNYRDRERIFAAHASGTLFSQKAFLEKGGKLKPEYRFGRQRIDVGDKATELLHEASKGLVPVLPNSINSPDLIEAEILKLSPVFYTLAKNGSAISLSNDHKHLVFGHMGRGTPRSESDPAFSHKMPIEFWIEQIESIVS